MADEAPSREAGEHPLIEAGEAERDRARARRDVAVSAYLPKVDVLAAAYVRGTGALLDGSFEGGSAGLWPDTTNWALGVAVRFPLLDFALRQETGNVRIGDVTAMVPINSVVPRVQELAEIPIRTGAGPAVLLRDVAYVEDGSDVLTSYALVDGKRSVYIPVTKRADASTLSVVERVRRELPRMRASIPEDIRVDFAFDQSGYVRNAIRSLASEGLLGALLTGIMVLLFLRHLRSSLIVVVTIPLALLSAVVALWAAGQTINVMTLGG